MAKDVEWIKITTDMFDNGKIKQIRKLPEGNNIVLVWVMLLTLAGRCNSGGMIILSENIPYNVEMLATELNFEPSVIQIAISALEKFNMIHTDDECFVITNWYEYQSEDGLEKIRSQTRKRVSDYRERQKALRNVTVTLPVTQTSYSNSIYSNSLSNNKDNEITNNIKDITNKKESLIDMYRRLVNTDKYSYISVPVREVLEEWFLYKMERKDKMVERGMKKFLTEMMNYEQEYGAAQLIEVINKTMSSGYQGIVRDWLTKSPVKNDGTIDWTKV